MADFEIGFEVDELSDAALVQLAELFDVVASEHAGMALVTVIAPGENAVAAAKAVVGALDDLGVEARRSHLDLVTRADIAQRCDATPQAIGQWIRGERMRQVRFPAPFHDVAGGVWLWGEVNRWLAKVGKDHDPVGCPSRNEHVAIDHWLANRVGSKPLAAALSWTHHGRMGATIPVLTGARTSGGPREWRGTRGVESCWGRA
ncbi:hypothetical protein [Saccharopolyspora sp. ASAGF58]|uniref:hypothetical protein n=1 Tax=Saccharopolyspora sp. ASAGF58 TaxID=2719023 RepID=UPI00144000FB|nr:hypothetical protein [Saccharopolyspora sp. ASAGF58]QIZ35034.1 hypothetical protein FDZ84_10225 [Saccharopolyspora sp. ASAGF58]